MAKAKEATETTGTTERKEKGTSIPAQAKDLVIRIADELAADGELSASTHEWLHNLKEEIENATVRGLSPEKQLEKAQNERNAIYMRAGVTDGVFAFANEADEALNGKLTVKIENLKRKIAKAKAGESGEADTDTTPAEETES